MTIELVICYLVLGAGLAAAVVDVALALRRRWL